MYERIMAEALERKELKQKRDEEFILKYLFMQLDSNATGVISKQELFDFLAGDENV